MDGAWCLVVVGVVDWFYLMVINAGVKPSQSAGMGDWARGTGRVQWLGRDGIAQYGTALMDGAWCLVVVGVVDWFYLMVIPDFWLFYQ